MLDCARPVGWGRVHDTACRHTTIWGDLVTTFTVRRIGALTTSAALALTLFAPAAAAAPGGPESRVQEVRDRITAVDGGGVSAASATDHEELEEVAATEELRFACPDGRVPESALADLQPPFDDAIECLLWYGVTQGRTATTFDQGATVTRVQMAIFIHRMLDNVVDLPAYDGTSAFDDVADDDFGAAEINVLASQEFADRFDDEPIVAGRADGSFDPRSAVRRDQMAAFLARAFRAIAADAGATFEYECENVFEDQDEIPVVHRDNVELLCGFRIATGRADGSYGYAATVTRGQMAAFLMRTFDVFTQVDLTLLPDRNLFVDAEACAPGATGTATAPLCTIQAAADRAADVEDDLVLIRVRQDVADPTAYTEAVDLRAGSGADVLLIAQSDEQFIELDGSVTTSAAGDGLAALIGFVVAAGDAGTALTVGGQGDVVFVDVLTDGAQALTIDQVTGATFVFDSVLTATDRVVDVVGSQFVVVEDSAFVSEGADAFLVLPEGVDAAELAFYTEEGAGNVFDPADPVETEIDGRAALVPAG